MSNLRKKYQNLSKELAELQLVNVELENVSTQQGRTLLGLEKKNFELVEDNSRLEDLMSQLREEVNRLDSEKKNAGERFYQRN